MATSDYSPLLRTSVGRNTAVQHHQPIDAHYYNVTDEESWPIAGLLVLLDGEGMPVRAELHIDDSLDDEIIEVAMRRARLMLQDQYIGGDPVSLRVLENFQMRAPLEIRLPPLGARPALRRRRHQWQTYAAGGAVVLAAALLIWFLIGALRGDEPTTAGADDPDTPQTAMLESASPSSASSDGADNAPVEADAAAETQAVDSTAGESNLPPSRNARPDLGIGMRVRIVPGLQLALRSEPGADAGQVIGAMADGTEAVIIGGPRYTQGTEDTIVWWYIELENGVQAWAAANTSSQTLLIPTE